ncbi:hypothetical protein ACFLTJ_01865 [Chloroflexota bacterium]
MVETKGYEFYWNIHEGGYELVDNTLYEYRGKVTGTPFDKYYADRIFFHTELLARRRQGESTATYVDALPPWLVLKETRVRLRELELIKEGKMPADDLRMPIPRRKGYRPLSDPVLHRKFASLRTEALETEALRFANKYGLLGRAVRLHPVKLVSQTVKGESLYRWRAEIDKMGVLLAIWDWVRKDDAGKLGQIIIWPSPESVVIRFKWKSLKGEYEILPWPEEDFDVEEEDQSDYSSQSSYAYVEDLLDEVLPRPKKPPAWFKPYRRGEVVGPARHYLYSMINYHLREITPSLNPWVGGKVDFRPRALLDALWLMFMLEVNGAIRTCFYCGGPFEPTRKDNIYCSKNCKRMAHYYTQQKRGGKP